MEDPPLLPRDEQYPLLKVDGAGDSNTRSPPIPSIVSSRWNVTCANVTKQSWCSRWPELVSACWMTIVLVAISFLVFYAWTMNAYARQPVVIVRCNDFKPASEVFYHHIVSRDSHVPFSLFSGYISFMARQYSSLRFNVYFLIDDTFDTIRSRHLKVIKRFVPQLHEHFFKSHERREILEFQEKYQNVNVSVLYLSHYMAMTPYKYKWRTIPLSYLPFYARIFATWQNGGVGLDLVAFNNQFNSEQKLDQRVDSILRLHNNGIESVKYADTFKSLDNIEDNKLFSTLFDIINQMLNETFTFFNTQFSPETSIDDSKTEEPKNRTRHYIKTENMDLKVNNSVSNDSKNDTDKMRPNLMNVKDQDLSSELNKTIEFISNSKIFNESNGMTKNNLNLTVSNGSMSLYDMPQVYLFYDTSGFSFNGGPSYYLPKAFQLDSFSIKNPFLKRSVKRNERKSNYLSISPEGHFVATSSKHHPFLAQLFTSGCLNMNPKYAIKDTLFSQCSGFFRDDVYCENIRLIYEAI